MPILLDSVPEKKKLKATTKLSKEFDTELPEDTIHALVHPPPGGLHVDIMKIMGKFFAPCAIANLKRMWKARRFACDIRRLPRVGVEGS
ncbi:MAG: hypothetical protein J3Q66DRAFT_404874 [Benniella sp.]|nr:MAG: hypothetical protein J3Q66DRAFT_404874 [Benniella sp.]